MEKEIIVDNGMKKKLSDDMGTTYITVRRSLRGRVSTPLHMAIREAALKLGGRIVEDKTQDPQEP